MENNEMFTEEEQAKFKKFAEGIQDVANIMIGKVSEVQTMLSKSQAAEYTEVWNKEKGEEKVNELKGAIDRLQTTMRKL